MKTRYSLDIKADDLGGDDYNTIEMLVYYTKGGYDYFRGGTIKRGIFFSISALKVKNEGMFTSRSFVMFGDDRAFKYLLEETKRGNAKKLEAMANKVFSMDTERVAELYKADDKYGIVEMVKESLAMEEAA